jgi:hypothetical protein
MSTTAAPATSAEAAPVVTTVSFAEKFVGVLFVMSGLMIPAAVLVRPVHVQWWDPTHFPTVAASMDTWIWSVRILVFGLFLRVGAWAALGGFAWKDDIRALVSAGTMISILGCLVSALGHGYYMDTGVWGSWAINQPEYAGEAGRTLLLSSLRPVNAWGECCIRMGSVFYSLGACFLSAAFLRDRFLPKPVALAPMLYGFAGMGIGMFMANDMAANLTVAGVQSAWCLAAGAALLAGRARS